MSAHGGERVSRTAKLPLSAQRPGYSEGTALHARRLTAAGRTTAQKRSEATYFSVTGTSEGGITSRLQVKQENQLKVKPATSFGS
ncbi:hypothetical protein J2067_005156 [Erwinia rhapontici]|nr:hypothetical protein [Erwinia rhapontici]